ncbi:hypothetical protein BTA73_23775 [Salmonella enterica subsp. enterica serovar Reading]|nr:hypothetical protein [Salmonella enterica]EBP2212685.1 hypothetical protein [Salmonella enterica]EBP7109925.1 hypothetical protein [Salmonella enterica]EBW8773051.1 hypothetical protein [Salmonella enterica subsp. enterica serovar Reading]
MFFEGFLFYWCRQLTGITRHNSRTGLRGISRKRERETTRKGRTGGAPARPALPALQARGLFRRGQTGAHSPVWNTVSVSP